MAELHENCVILNLKYAVAYSGRQWWIKFESQPWAHQAVLLLSVLSWTTGEIRKETKPARGLS